VSAIKAHAALLATHADLLETIYRQRSLTATPETARALAKLESARILLCDEDGGYRLHPRERQYIDAIQDRIRVFDSGNPISEEIARLRELSHALKTADAAGDVAGHADYLEETIDTILTLRTRIDDRIRIFDGMVHSGYHDARTIEERLQRNAFYQEQARHLIDTIDALNGPVMRDLFSGWHLGAARGRYRRDIIDRVETWSVRLSGLYGEMLEFMYRSRRIEARTKRFRLISAALEKVPPGDMIDAIDLAESPLVPLDLGPRIRFDPRAARNEEALIAAAAKIDPEASRSAARVRHLPGKVVAAAPPPPEEADPVAETIDGLLAEVREKGGPVSVRQWARAHAPDHVDDLVTDLFDHMMEGEEGVRMRTLPEGDDRFTIGVHDVILEAA
jgi:hypothetical protein